MINVRISFTPPNIAGLGNGSFSLFQKQQMMMIGNFAIKTVRERVQRGIGSDDSQMPALSGKTSPIVVHGKFVRQRLGYAGWKSRHGLQPIRDLVGSGRDGGHMLDNLSVRSVSERSVRMSLTARKARAKALSNEKKSPWLSFSESDEKKIVEYARTLFKAQVEVLRKQLASRSIRRAA